MSASLSYFSVIHPFDKFRLYFKYLVFILNLFYFIFFILEAAFELDINLKLFDSFATIIFSIEIFLNFLTGYIQDDRVIFERKEIISNYLGLNLIKDLTYIIVIYCRNLTEDYKILISLFFYLKLPEFLKFVEFKNQEMKLTNEKKQFYFCLFLKIIFLTHFQTCIVKLIDNYLNKVSFNIDEGPYVQSFLASIGFCLNIKNNNMSKSLIVDSLLKIIDFFILIDLLGDAFLFFSQKSNEILNIAQKMRAVENVFQMHDSKNTELKNLAKFQLFNEKELKSSKLAFKVFSKMPWNERKELFEEIFYKFLRNQHILKSFSNFTLRKMFECLHFCELKKGDILYEV